MKAIQSKLGLFVALSISIVGVPIAIRTAFNPMTGGSCMAMLRSREKTRSTEVRFLCSSLKRLLP